MYTSLTGVVREALCAALERRAGTAGRDTALRVLDTRGGTGHFAVPVALLGHQVTVVDPSPDALFALERRAAEAGAADRVRGVQGDVHGLFEAIEPGAFDAVLCHGVLDHVDDPAAALDTVVAALRPEGGTLSVLAAGLGGTVLHRALTGHFSEAREALADPEGRWGAADPMPRRFTADRLRALVEGAGAEIEAVYGARIFTDLVPGPADSEQDPDRELARLESAAARMPAFHAVAGLLYVLAGTGGARRPTD